MSDGPIFSKRGPAPVGPYPHAHRAGELLFVSGIGPRDPLTNAIPEGIEAQTRSTIENIRGILEDAGCSLADVVDVTVFLTEIKRDFAGMNSVYAEYFGETRPSRTTVGVTGLPTAIDVELKVVARLGPGSP